MIKSARKFNLRHKLVGGWETAGVPGQSDSQQEPNPGAGRRWMPQYIYNPQDDMIMSSVTDEQNDRLGFGRGHRQCRPQDWCANSGWSGSRSTSFKHCHFFRRKYGRSSTIAQFSPLLIGFTRYRIVFVNLAITLWVGALELKKLSFQSKNELILILKPFVEGDGLWPHPRPLWWKSGGIRQTLCPPEQKVKQNLFLIHL